LANRISDYKTTGIKIMKVKIDRK